MLLGAAALAPHVAAAGPKIWQSQDVSITEAEVDLHARPAVVYRVLTDYAAWASLFSDVVWATQKAGGREDAIVQYKSRTFGKPQHFKFNNRANRLVRYDLVDGPSGVRVWWQVALEPVGDTGVTRVRLRMSVHVGGFYGWFISDGRVRKYRERKVTADINDLARRFPPEPPPSRPAAKAAGAPGT